MKFNRKTVTTLIMVALVALAGIGAFAGSGAAATTTLAGDGTDEVTGFTANESNDLEYTINSDDGTNGFDGDGTTTLKMNITYNGEQYAITEEAVSDGTATSQAVNISNDELSDLPGDAGESVNVTVNAWGEDDSGTETTTMDTFDVTITFDNGYAVVTVDDGTATTEDVGDGGILGFGANEKTIYTYEETVGVDGDNTTVTVNDATDNGASAFDDAIGDKENGDVIYGAAAAVDGSPVLAFEGEADADRVDLENDTYAVHNSDGTWTFNLGDDYADAQNVDVFVSSQSYASADFDSDELTDLMTEQADMSMTGALSTFGLDAFGALNLFSMASVPFVGGMAVPGVSLAGLFVVSRRRLAA